MLGRSRENNLPELPISLVTNVLTWVRRRLSASLRRPFISPQCGRHYEEFDRVSKHEDAVHVLLLGQMSDMANLKMMIEEGDSKKKDVYLRNSRREVMCSAVSSCP